MALEHFFHPASVMIVGARPDDGHVGSAIMKNLLAGAPRELYPVNSNYQNVLGIPAYSSIGAVPKSPDLAIIAVASTLVPAVLRACVEKKVKAAVVISAGFKEAGEEGKKLEAELTQIGQSSGLPFLGPNCLGVIDGKSDLNASFAGHKPLPGGISFISQSGAIGTAFIEWSREEGVGVSKFVSLGNEAGISEIDMLEYLGNDEETKAILLYVEHISDGPRFLSVAKDIATNKKKPIVLLRAGRSARGSAAVMSHTGSLAPQDKVFTSACRQAGIATVESVDELFNVAKLLALHSDWVKTTQIAIVTNGGGPSANAADLVEFSESLSLASFDDDTKESLRSVLPSMAAVGNPVDVIGDAGADRFTAALDIVTTKSTVDAIIVIVTPQMMTDAPAIAKTIAQYKGVMPIIPVFMGGSVMQSGISVLIENGMVNFASPSSAITALDALILHKKAKTVVIKSATKDVSSHASHMLSYDEMTSLLSQYALTVSGTIARTKDDALRVYDELGGSPVAMKVVSQNVVHKTDVHAVELNVSRLDVHRVWDEIEEKIRGTYLGAEIEGMLLQPMTSGKEVIIGMTRDATFGPVIVFGLGGIFVELLSDVAMRIPPFLHDEARKMIDEIAGIKYLDGFRGSLPVDKDSLAHILVSIGNLAIAHPDITEIDFNPVIVTNEGAHIVDARVMKRN